MTLRHLIYYAVLSALCIVLAASPLSVHAAKSSDKKLTIVLDAGHGGKDVGACDNGLREKDINLAVALKAGEMISKKLKNVKVVYTRSDDSYLTLQERADKANKAKGDLFISIHTNSVDLSNKNRANVQGASVYALGLHKDKNNMAVAQRENAVIELESDFQQKYSGFNPQSDESYIIFELAQKGNLSRSIKFAKTVQDELVATAGRVDRGVHQAGFWVLWATSMPAVLVELDFICNPTSAEYISSETGQKKMAEAIFNAVKKYAESQQMAANAPEEEPEEAEDHDNLGADIQEVVAIEPTPKTTAPTLSSTSTATTGKRRRRSESARIASENRNVTTDHIAVQSEQEGSVAEEPRRKEVASAQQDSEVNVTTIKKRNGTVSREKGAHRTSMKAKGTAKQGKNAKQEASTKTDSKQKGKQKTRICAGREVVVSD